MKTAPAHAKLNLALVVGPRREDGLHEVATVMQRIALADRISVEPSDKLSIEGFPADTLVRRALEALGGSWKVRIDKEIPVAAGLGGGSSDAATALQLASESREQPLEAPALHELAATLGADVPFFLTSGPKLARGTGTELEPLNLPQDYAVVLVLPRGGAKASTASVYEAFDERGGGKGFEARRAALLEALKQIAVPEDLAALPPNDLSSSPLADELHALGAFRADVTGAGPAVYGLFPDRASAEVAAAEFGSRGAVWVSEPAW
jgi:4-diphosphocytidyl-2-C-methyl-D-erythritol kinase